jgi:hypothetical protein
VSGSYEYSDESSGSGTKELLRGKLKNHILYHIMRYPVCKVDLYIDNRQTRSSLQDGKDA